MPSWSRNTLKIGLFSLGVGLLFFFIHKLGWQDIIQYLGRVGWGIIPILSLSLGWYILNCLAWEQFLEDRKEKLSLFQLFRIKLSGEAINSATPVSFMAGDPLRIALMRPFLSTSEGAASVILDRTAHSLTAASLMGTGLLLALATLNLSAPLRLGLLITMLVMSTALFFTVYHQHRGLLQGLLYLADRIKIGRFIPAALRDKNLA